MFFTGGGKGKNLAFTIIAKGCYVFNLKLSACQRSRFVEYKRVSLCESLNIFSAFYQNSDFGSRSDSRIVGEGNGDNNGAGTGCNKTDKRPVYPLGELAETEQRRDKRNCGGDDNYNWCVD